MSAQTFRPDAVDAFRRAEDRPAQRLPRIGHFLHEIEDDVAHLYYFLGQTEPGTVTPVIEPRSRARLELTTGASSDQEVRVGATTLPARRIEYSSGESSRWVWFDALGRVLRVEVPATGYVAERTDVLP